MWYVVCEGPHRGVHPTPVDSLCTMPFPTEAAARDFYSTKLLGAAGEWDPITVVFADGGCTGNGTGHARASIGVFWGEADPRNVSRPVEGPLHTNNVAELQAIRVVLDQLLHGRPTVTCARIFTDSKYSISCLEDYMPMWEAKGWKTSSGGDPKNLDLLKDISSRLSVLKAQGRDIQLVHVFGHTGVKVSLGFMYICIIHIC
jgi:ribonuclease HI